MANPFQFKTKLKTLSNNGLSLYNELFHGKKNVIISPKSGGGPKKEEK